MLEKVNFDEAKQSQLPFVELLVNLGYEYISTEDALQQRGNNTSKFILRDIARKKLNEINSYSINDQEIKFSPTDIENSIDALENIPLNGLLSTSEEIYNMLMPREGGRTVEVIANGKKTSKNFRYIDFVNIENNDFHVTLEYTVSGKQNIRIDIVCFINGIPIVAIENKKPEIELLEAIKQQIRNQDVNYAPKFFTFTQILVASNMTGLKYGTTTTPKNFYTNWKESENLQNNTINSVIQKKIDPDVYSSILKDLNGFTIGHNQIINRTITEQDLGILSLLDKKRLMDLIENFIIFDSQSKIITRYQQYNAIHKTLEKINTIHTESGISKRLGGLIWHTQGTGKSLMMVMFVKAIIEDKRINNPRIIVVTDRKQLDKQISETFKDSHIKKEVVRATSGEHLYNLIKSNSLNVITTTIQKFKSIGYRHTIIPDKDTNLFILIDEAHRSQSGISNHEMQKLLPNACIIGYTGTPLMKRDKESWRKFGGYIDKYTISDGLDDGIILPLLYKSKGVLLTQDSINLDKYADRVQESVDKMVDENKLRSKKIYELISKQDIVDNQSAINLIALDIEQHFKKYFQCTGLKGQIVAPTKYSAILLQEAFEILKNVNTVVIISDENNEDVDDAHKQIVTEYLKKIKSKFGTLEKYENESILDFKTDTNTVELLIVVDKLLTGFDAPRNTVMYLIKNLKEHNLLQAIARVNRLFENGEDKLQKTAGYIVDYSENGLNLKQALELFSGKFDKEDVTNTLVDYYDKYNELEQKYASISKLFAKSNYEFDLNSYLEVLKDTSVRNDFYDLLKEFIKIFNECELLNYKEEFEDKREKYAKELVNFLKLKKVVNIAHSENIDFKKVKTAIAKILDGHIRAEEIIELTEEIEITDSEKFNVNLDKIESNKSKAEAITANIQKIISEKVLSDPESYQRFSQKVQELINQIRDGKINDANSLSRSLQIREELINQIDTTNKSDAFYNLLYRNIEKYIGNENKIKESFIHKLISVINKNIIVDWQINPEKIRILRNCIDDFIYDYSHIHGLSIVSIKNEELVNFILDIIQRNDNLIENAG